ncbi:MAG: CDP-diacylglycerol--glycerol-3-phosphate 3-phosphatidyltransferase [Clostridiaceae bacterium]|jgi:CDP-diacylglycerol--glycerol-3-phosphate 3-phosphatidyltransferase/cardiolipin synthase|nr:CDP-diacylglycerol--glycerol-3-phosphate 3-phosphatidyltransferase [Clostridiaceae bacterium]
MNMANKLTLSRILLVPFILFFLLPLPWAEDAAFSRFVLSSPGRSIAFVLFILAALTDAFDGLLARKQGIVSDLGKLLDPIADKILVISVFTAFVQLGRVSTYILTIIIARELIVTGIRQVAAIRGTVIAASWFGKIKTVIQVVTLIVLIFEPIVANWLDPSLPFLGYGAPYSLPGDIMIAVSAIITVLSGLDYGIKNKDIWKEEP